MVELQDAQKEADVTSEATERELELEAQLVEARSIIQEQVNTNCLLHFSLDTKVDFYWFVYRFLALDMMEFAYQHSLIFPY